MTFVTKLILRSGDRNALERFVAEIKAVAERKGVELKGPHTPPPESYRVPLYRGLGPEKGEYPAWEFTVYERGFRLAGHDEAVRQVAGREPPPQVHVEAEVTQVRPVGSRNH